MDAGGSEGRGAIQALIKLVQAGGGKRDAGRSGAAEEAEEHSEEDGRQGKRRKKGAQPLCRPLIAICNDLYAPALRPLRAVAKIVHYKKPTARFPLLLLPTLLCFNESLNAMSHVAAAC